MDGNEAQPLAPTVRPAGIGRRGRPRGGRLVAPRAQCSGTLRVPVRRTDPIDFFRAKLY
ncbi:hypothetical protein MCM47_28695 [Kitasatospora sp. A2-31]|nr:hypothetical protein [Kitasatospora sp. A2-31]